MAYLSVALVECRCWGIHASAYFVMLRGRAAGHGKRNGKHNCEEARGAGPGFFGVATKFRSVGLPFASNHPRT